MLYRGRTPSWMASCSRTDRSGPSHHSSSTLGAAGDRYCSARPPPARAVSPGADRRVVRHGPRRGTRTTGGRVCRCHVLTPASPELVSELPFGPGALAAGQTRGCGRPLGAEVGRPLAGVFGAGGVVTTWGRSRRPGKATLLISCGAILTFTGDQGTSADFFSASGGLHRCRPDNAIGDMGSFSAAELDGFDEEKHRAGNEVGTHGEYPHAEPW